MRRAKRILQDVCRAHSAAGDIVSNNDSLRPIVSIRRSIHNATSRSAVDQTREQAGDDVCSELEWETALSQVAGVADDRASAKYSAAMPVSNELVSIYRQLQKGRGMESLARSVSQESDAEQGHALLAEAIELWQTAVGNARHRDVGETEIRLIDGLAAILREQTGDMTPRVVNGAPAGRLPWEVVDTDESIGTIHWACDLTEGRAADPWRNAKLADEAKSLLYTLHTKDPSKYTAQKLSEMFRIRQQRVMAILALKSLEPEAEDGDDELQELMDQVHDCCEGVGSGERHYTILPSYPNYQELDAEKVYKNAQSLLPNMSAGDDIPSDVAHDILGIPDQSVQEEQLATQEEIHMVERFEATLDRNLESVRTTDKKPNRKSQAAKRPEDGWKLTVTRLDK